MHDHKLLEGIFSLGWDVGQLFVMIWTLCNEMNALYESTTEEGTARTTSEQIQLQPGQLPR